MFVSGPVQYFGSPKVPDWMLNAFCRDTSKLLCGTFAVFG